jgi:hypothetical protein
MSPPSPTSKSGGLNLFRGWEHAPVHFEDFGNFSQSDQHSAVNLVCRTIPQRDRQLIAIDGIGRASSPKFNRKLLEYLLDLENGFSAIHGAHQM